jgi:hypothetical protein
MDPCPEMLPENFIVGGTIKSPDLTRAAYLIDLPGVGAASRCGVAIRRTGVEQPKQAL